MGTPQGPISEAEASEELRFQKSLLEAQSEASLDGILVVSRDGKLLSSNRRFVEMWKIPGDVIAIGSDAAALAAVEDQLA
ncbi:MAG: hybrid sensor histidine kinase/response regulator, partial [Chloroflexota bacterium]